MKYKTSSIPDMLRLEEKTLERSRKHIIVSWDLRSYLLACRGLASGKQQNLAVGSSIKKLERKLGDRLDAEDHIKREV